MADWQTLSSQVAYETPWIKVRRDDIVNHAGKKLTYSVIELHRPSVFILAFDKEGRLLIQQNYRYPLDRTVWEFPAGHNDGEEPLEAAQRELREEAGLASGDWTYVGRLYQAAGIGNIPADYFVARQAYPVAQAAQDEEEISHHRFVTLHEFDVMVQNGDFIQSADLAAVYLAQAKGLIDKE